MTQENMLARYGILHELGRGATGAVYAARDRQTGRVVALKRLDPGLFGKPGASSADRFLRHARPARLLKHRNIAEVHDAGEIGGTVYLAMEMLEGRSLRDILAEGPLPIARAIRIAHDIASGLAHAHLEGVVHGALKPSNVIVLRSGVAKITDFGIGDAALVSAAQGGAPGYRAPEQVRGEPVDHRCDVFSLGALLYEMLTRRPAFAGASPKDGTRDTPCAELAPPSELNPHVPRVLDDVVLAMLARQPASRMPGVPILLQELQRLEEGLGLASDPGAAADEAKPNAAPAAPEPRSPDPARDAFDYQSAMAIMDREARRERSSGSRPPIFAALAAVLAVLGVGLGGFMYYSAGPAELRNAVSRIQESLATALAMSRPTATAPVAEATREDLLSSANPMPPKPLAQEPVALAQREPPLARAAEQPAEQSIAASRVQQAPGAPAKQPWRAMQPTVKAAEQQTAGTARLILAVSPRGEIYIDGRHHGTTPPITSFDLEPGMHRIEIRSGSRTPYLTYVTLEAGDVRRIRHDFDTRGAVYPRKGR